MLSTELIAAQMKVNIGKLPTQSVLMFQTDPCVTAAMSLLATVPLPMVNVGCAVVKGKDALQIQEALVIDNIFSTMELHACVMD